MSLTRSVIQPPFDIDAQRFIYATGITNFTQKRAVNYLVKGLKSNNLWTKMSAVYPMVGGTAWTCKWNLINPRDSDLAFRLNFIANPTITYQGVDWNGSTQYAKTNLVPSVVIASENSSHISYYSRENLQEAGVVIAISDAVSSPSRYAYLQLRTSGDVMNIDLYGLSTANTSQANTDSRGFFIVSRVNNSQIIGTIRGVSTTSTNASSGLSTFQLYIGARNNNDTSVTAFATTQCAFASIGSGLTTTDCFNFTNIVNQFQIILGRQV